MKRLLVFWASVYLLGILSLLSLGEPALGQNASGRIMGTVFDPQGALVPGAKVTVVDVATQISHATISRKDGTFEVLNLPIATYRVEVEHDGFAKAVTQENRLQINQSLQFNITLALGATDQTVAVEAQLAEVETVSPTIGASVIGEAIQQAPLNGRDVLQLALLQPGVTEANPDDQAARAGTNHQFSIAGGRSDSVTFLLDGGLNNNLLDNSVVFNPNPDAIAEFRILESNYTAEFGRNGGGIISEVTKSGTNSWHGSAYDYLRNGDLDANSYFRNLNGIPRDPLRRNQYGGSVGGPIIIPHVINGKDRFFFFVAYQGQKQSDQATPTLSQVPVFTSAQTACIAAPTQGCDFSSDPNVVSFLASNPFFQAAGKPAGFLNPQALNPVSVNYITKGLIPASSSGIVTPTGSQTDNYNQLTLRFDFQVTAKDQITATLGGERNPNLTPFATPASSLAWADVGGFGVTNQLNSYFLNLAYTRTISPNMINELRFSTQRANSVQAVPQGPNALLTTTALGFASNFKPDDPTGPPLIGLNNESTTAGYTYLGPSTLINNTFAVSDTFTWVRGAQTWKMGGGFEGYQNNQIFDFVVNGIYDFDGTLTGNGFADFLLGIPSDFQQSPSAPSNIRTKSTYGFFEDEWRATKRLNLTFGLRYEYNSPKYDTQGRTFSIVPGDQSTRFVNAPVGLVFPGDKGAPTGVNFPVKNNWAPRFGFAWDPKGDGKTSLRGGIGIFYDILKAEDNFQFNGQEPFFGTAFIGTGSSAGNFPTSLTGNSCANANQPGQRLTYFSDPYTSTCTPNPFPSTPPTSNFDFSALGPFGGGSSFFVDPHLRTPYTYQYNMSIQHELASNLIMEVNYLGSSSHGLTALQDVNPFVLGTTNRILNLTPGNSSCQDATGNSTSGLDDTFTCSLAAIDEFRNIVNANYNAVTASLTKNQGNTPLGNVYFTLAYTYGHSIDNASGFRQKNDGFVPSYGPEHTRASSDFDVRNRFVFSGGWELPFDRAWRSGPKRLTQGWTLFPIFTWHSGFPLDIFANLPSEQGSFNEGPSGAGDYLVARANVVGPTNTLNPKVMRDLGAGPGNYWFNPNSFSNAQCGDVNNPGPCTPGPTIFPSDSQAVSNPAFRTYGTLARNSLRGPGLVNLDLSIAKTTAITERLKLEIRGDFFNILNHAEFSNPDTNIQDLGSTFGEILNTGVPGDERPRIIQIAARLSF